jgi:hypothetical protein
MNDEDPVEQGDEVPEPIESTTSRRKAKKSESRATPRTAPRPAPAPQAAPRVRFLSLRNRSGTLLFLPVLNGDGTKKSLRMGANAIVKVQEDHLTDHARRLLSQGQISIDPNR